MPKKRCESAFGIHFDFHAMSYDVIPEIWKPEYYAQMLDAVKPDFVQCDTKGHEGYSSYPTIVGNRGNLKEDILAMMREETAKRDIALYAHHSGIYDRKAAADHPEWAAVGIDGKPSEDFMSVFGPFVDELLLPQLRELAGTYKLDGAWIDGDCWAAQVDYSEHAVNAYKKEYGKEPPLPDDDDYEDYREFCRTGFRNYVRYYVNTIKKEFSNFEITSNWIFSAFMPEKMDIDVDFLSGDYANCNAVESARFNGRVIEARNITWDLMAWGQNAIPCDWMTDNRQTKELVQYQQEAAVIVAMGGGFEFFNIHYASGGVIQNWAIPTWAKTAEFCRERAACFKSKIREEFGILLSLDRNAIDHPFVYRDAISKKWCDMWVNAMQDCQYSTKILFEDTLCNGNLDNYQVIVIPSSNKMPQSAIDNLTKFVEKGGIVIVDNPSVKHFDSATPVAEKRQIFVDANGALAAAESYYCDYIPADATPCGSVYFDNIYDVEAHPAYSVKKQGQGVFSYLNINLGDFYILNRSNTLRVFLKKMIADLGYKPAVKVEGSRFADLTVTCKDADIIINLTNVAGEHNVPCCRSYDEIPLLGELKITLDASLGIKDVSAVTDVDFSIEKENGIVKSITLRTLHIHSAFICKK